MLAYLKTNAGPPAKTFDVILASYAVHHLPIPEKQAFFQLAHETLAPHGSLLYADIFRRDGESRAEYLDCYIDMMRTSWPGMSAEGLASTTEHITQRDFPETGDTISALALEAGFGRRPQELFRDATGFHRLMALTKNAHA